MEGCVDGLAMGPFDPEAPIGLKKKDSTWECLFRLCATCPACLPCPCPAWVRRQCMGADLGVPLPDLRLLCGSIDGWGERSRYVYPKFCT